jgi:hypothetical protein
LRGQSVVTGVERALCRGGMDKGKRAKVEDEDASELDAELVQAIEKLQEVQDELERVWWWWWWFFLFLPRSKSVVFYLFILVAEWLCAQDVNEGGVEVGVGVIGGDGVGV